MTSGKSKGQTLAAKEAKLFKELLRDFEDRTYKKGLKTAEAILKKSPEHGETICMKGITMYHMGKKQEGIDLVKKGVKLDVASHICWHVSALIWKAERDLPQALASYAQAVKIDSNQIALVRDLITLQLQLRQLSDAIENRIHLLSLQPRQRSHWLGLAVTYHLNKQFEDALDTLQRYSDMQSDHPKRDYDHSELVMYRAMVLEEAGQKEEALALLDSQRAEITDRTGMLMQKARLLLARSDEKGAERIYRALLDDNPESYASIQGFLQARACSLETGSEQKALECLDELHAALPRSLAIRRLALQSSAGQTFSTRVRAYLKEFFTKGIPSLFVNIKALYKDDSKRKAIEDIVLGFQSSLEKKGTLEEDETSEAEAPTTLVWVLYFLAQHYSALGQDQKAVDYINRVIEHTPILPDLLMMKARIFKRAGDAVSACAIMEDARQLDGQDRFLNGKAAKYHLRVGRIAEAESLAGLFTKKDALTPVSDLTDMQCLWYLLEEGQAWRRKGDLGMALKRFLQIDNIFNIWKEDEYDFHTWCLRKATIRSYIALMRCDDRLRSHPAFYTAVREMVEIYIELDIKKTTTDTNGHANGVDDEELRKAQKKAKKADAKAKSAPATQKTNVAPAKKDEDDVPGPKVDDDLKGLKLLATQTPLEDAAKLVGMLEAEASQQIETWLLSVDLNMRRKRYVAVLRALRQAHALDPSHTELFVRLVAFDKLARQENGVSAEAKKLYESVKKDVFPFENMDAATASMLQQSKPDRAQILLSVIQISPVEVQADLALQMLSDDIRCTPALATSAFKLLEQSGSPRTNEFKSVAAQRFPFATAFTDQQIGPKENTEDKQILQ